MTKGKIPRTDSIRELADFWDTHDLTDFDEELEEVTETVFELEKVLQVHLPTQDAETVESMAQAQGLDAADLIRAWVREKTHTSS